MTLAMDFASRLAAHIIEQGDRAFDNMPVPAPMKRSIAPFGCAIASNETNGLSTRGHHAAKTAGAEGQGGNDMASALSSIATNRPLCLGILGGGQSAFVGGVPRIVAYGQSSICFTNACVCSWHVDRQRTSFT